MGKKENRILKISEEWEWMEDEEVLGREQEAEDEEVLGREEERTWYSYQRSYRSHNKKRKKRSNLV